MRNELSLALLTAGYTYAADMIGSAEDSPTAREVRVLGHPALLVAGRDAARLFYDETLMQREGAVPAPLSDELFGADTVHGLDGDAHRHRKSIHLDVLDARQIDRLQRLIEERWAAEIFPLYPRGDLPLFDALVQVLGSAVLEWAGLSDQGDVAKRSADLAAIVDGFGSIGRRHRDGRQARKRCEAWAAASIVAARARDTNDTPVGWVAQATDADGGRLPVETAAVELLNLLRPVVAISYFGSFIPAGLQLRPDWRARVGAGGDPAGRRAFVHELRRHYPFVPMLAARARQNIQWHGHDLAAGDRLLLHVVATNHDPSVYPDPWEFRPERFIEQEPDPFAFVSQGGGSIADGHRCPGEPTVVAVLEQLAQHIADLSYADTPIRFDPKRMPTHPERGAVLQVRDPQPPGSHIGVD